MRGFYRFNRNSVYCGTRHIYVCLQIQINKVIRRVDLVQVFEVLFGADLAADAANTDRPAALTV